MENTYLFVIISLASVAFASFVSYDADRVREIRFALGIILLASLSVPLASAVKGFSDVDFSYTGEGVSSNLVEKTVEEAFCEGIAEAVIEEFSVKRGEISVTARGFDSEKMRAETLCVTLSGRAAFGDIGAIEDFVSGLGLGECILEVNFG